MLKRRSILRVWSGGKLRLSPDSQQFLIDAPNGRQHRMPIAQVDQLQVRVQGVELPAWIRMAQQSRPVLFVNRSGAVLAKLVAPERAEDRPTFCHGLDSQIIATEAIGYGDWLLAQKRHSVSLILRRRGGRPVPEPQYCQEVLKRGLNRLLRRGSVERNLRELDALLEGQVDSYIARNRLLRVKALLGDYGQSLAADLRDLLRLPAMRAWLRFLSEGGSRQPHALGSFFCELRPSLDNRANLHINAMHVHLRMIQEAGRVNQRCWMGGLLDEFNGDA